MQPQKRNSNKTTGDRTPALEARHSQRPRVLVVSNMYPSDQSPGFGVFVKDQVEALRKLSELNIEVWTFDPGGLNYLKGYLALRQFAKPLSFDLIHAHYGLSGWVAWAAGRAPVMVTLHGTDVQHPVVGRLSRLLAKRARLVATVSPWLRNLLDSRRSAPVLPTGVDTERFKPLSRPESRRQLGLDPDQSMVLFPSDPRRQVKRYDRASALVERFPDTRLIAVHNAPPREMPAWINAANAVLVTSDSEGFGLAVCEALACDVPVLATPVGIAPLALNGIPGTLCADFDLGSWSRMVSTHLGRRDPRIAGRDRAALFDRMRMARRTLCVYEDLLNQDLASERI